MNKKVKSVQFILRTRYYILLLLVFLSYLIWWYAANPTRETVGLSKGMAELPTLYEYYTEGGIKAGLETLPDTFQLNKKDITIFSGAIHYFRVHPEYWRDRLRKLRAAGFNAVETYVPWNLHEPEEGVYDFGDGGNDMSIFLDIVKYIKIAQEEDLLVLIRPSPYICSEWEFGGMPSWILRYPGLIVRSSQTQFTELVQKYNSRLLPLLENLQFTKGGPIIAFQIENEYGALTEDGSEEDEKYLEFLKEEFEKNGIVELLYTSDNPIGHGEKGALPGVLQTANFQSNPEGELSALKSYQPDKPSMVMEYWAGWFDHWFESHHTTSVTVFSDVLERILQFPASVNLYMFHGGTNFGFLNGANTQGSFPHYSADITSYDYDAPLTEAGDYTQKYDACKQIVEKYNKVLTKLPDPPPISIKMAYPSVTITGQLDYNQVVEKIGSEDRTESDIVKSMEMLSINSGNGQSYGYILYRYTGAVIQEISVLQIKNDAVYDMAVVLLDGERRTEKLESLLQLSLFGYWETKDAKLYLNSETTKTQTLDILVENWGRVNFGVRSVFDQRKGLRENTSILLDNNELKGWEIISLQFKSKWVNSLDGWNPVTTDMTGPKLFHATFDVDTAYDTFLDMRGWGRGAVFLNGFNLGRYFSAGPSHTLYVPAPLLKTGTNHIVIFELFTSRSTLVFTDKPLLN